jgi:hypothetical protein
MKPIVAPAPRCAKRPALGAIEAGSALPKLSVGDASVVEGTGGTRTLILTVTLSDASGPE